VDAHLLAGDKLQENPVLSGTIYFIKPVPAWDMVNKRGDVGDSVDLLICPFNYF
jgi:hypothetical protein